MPALSLSEQYPPNVEMIVVAWLSGLRRSGVAYRPGDPLPFTLVTRLPGTEDVFNRLEDPVVSVHTLCDKTLGYAAAAGQAVLTHRRMLKLANDLDDVPLPDATVGAVDYVKVFTPATLLPYEDTQILRSVTRYQIGVSYITAAPGPDPVQALAAPITITGNEVL